MNNYLEVGLAFVEGLALILSPCILPVLPLILSTGTAGDRSRPYGIIFGFVAAFSAFVLLSRQLVTLLNIQPEAIRDFSLVVLAILGVVMISERLSKAFSAFTQGFADIGGKFGGASQGGFWSGIPLGALIGFVWTPCAGPVLAAVLVQVIRQQTDLQSLLVTFAFAVGASIPMLIITLTGRRLLSKATFITAHTERLRKIFGVLILIAVGVMAFGANAAALLTGPAPMVQSAGPRMLTNPLPQSYPVPELVGIDGWINTEPFKLSDLKGKVVLVDFWTYSCINCIRTLPHLTELDKKYRAKGLVIVGVHSPEFEFEKNLENIRKATKQYGIEYPVASDPRLDTWANFHNQYWPQHYLVNQQGQVVYMHAGEGSEAILENNIRFLLGLSDSVQESAKTEINSELTPETYLGYARAQRFQGDFLRDKTQDYSLPASLAADQWGLSGEWSVHKEKLVSGGDNSVLKFHVRAKNVFLVLGTENGKPGKVTVTTSKLPSQTLTVDGHRLYTLAEFSKAESETLELSFSRKGIEAYAFTFGQ